MPTYAFHCDKCDEDFDAFRKIANRHEPLNEPCPKCGEVGGVTQRVTAPALCDPTKLMGGLKTDSRLREKLQQIHEKTPGSRLDQVSTITKL